MSWRGLFAWFGRLAAFAVLFALFSLGVAAWIALTFLVLMLPLR